MLTRVFDCSRAEERETGLEEAAAAIRRGELVVMPTDTVYGVAADAFSPAAVETLLSAKGRNRMMPVPVLVASAEMLDALVEFLPDSGRALTDAFWPGALTVVVRHTPHLAWDLGETRGTVAVRMPNHELARELVTLTGPLAVSSANRSGYPAPATMLDARLQLGASVAVYLDGGPSGETLPSTIVDVTSEQPRVLREGAISIERLREVDADIEEAW
jgi:tRNA threonylcarbamoyl adenosine modification protein (Sua5/YciO/YrdC/YwlC family)